MIRKLISKLLMAIKKAMCGHKICTWVRNIHGDEIRLRFWNRSVWKCNKCGAVVYKHFSHIITPYPLEPVESGNNNSEESND